ncbi:MAG TPA: hypothetical protein VNH53_11265 [Sphingomicrobium sp.]|jgi:hypothetical protein|nr:hypothetical protein [Sphingomicrobium sp.]
MVEVVKLTDLLPERLDSIGERAKSALCENEEIGCMKLAWDLIARELEGALRSALDCDLLEILAKGWAKARLLSDYADPAKHPPGERNVVEIGEHQVKRELHPVIAVTIASCPCVELKFTLSVAAHFGGLKLAIVDGHIVGGSPGEAWATAQLSYEGVPLHPSQESQKLALPGKFRFAPPGLPLALQAADNRTGTAFRAQADSPSVES